LSMKNDNLLWGVKRIQGELLKLDISLSTKTIRKILQAFRRRGKIRSSTSWKKFLETQMRFIYAMDFFTVDTMLGKRFYVFAIISHKTREIIQFSITENPTREFVRQQLILFTESIAGRMYLIHDNALMFNIDFLAYNLVSVRTGVEAPNMNSIMERFFRTVRREALDNFLLIGKNQIQAILEEYVAFYNSQRPHQGLQQQIPNPREPEKTGGAVCWSPVLGGLYHLSASGATSWYEYACRVVDRARNSGLPLVLEPRGVMPISSASSPASARRPGNSRLDCIRLRETFRVELPTWEHGVDRVLTELLELESRVATAGGRK